jgi:hypothetical protein
MAVDIRVSYVLEGWPQEFPQAGLILLPKSEKVREWCQAGKRVRVTFEVEPAEEIQEDVPSAYITECSCPSCVRFDGNRVLFTGKDGRSAKFLEENFFRALRVCRRV